jgi:methylmalonyl-CoA carboxyltransferase small subunit
VKLRITIAGKTYEAEVEVMDEESALPPEPVYVAPQTPTIFGVAETADNHVAADKVCRSPVTGLVIRVNVEAGQAVEAGELLMVLEAMKMETQVTAPCGGIVQTIHVIAGNSVKMNQLLAELD